MDMIILIESASALLRKSGTNSLRDREVLENNSFVKLLLIKYSFSMARRNEILMFT